ncbi:transporter substrate-binding domain-containing protein, partial [Halarcobacter sp.]|uniref:transporter substrate-binding domain-containing protein n=1 Tax=Halarcobacter sp. TaxID=2321133 RepID=UPI003A90E73B
MILKILFKLVLFFIFLLQLNASTKDIAKSEAEKIAEISSSFLYTLDEKQLSHTLNALVYDNKKIKALVVTENLEDKVMFSFYRDKDVLFFTEKIPKNLEYDFKIKQTIFFKDENIGSLILYYYPQKKENDFYETLSTEEKKYLNSLKKLKIQAEKDWMPYNYIEDDIEKGYSNDYTKLLAKVLDVKIEFIKGFSWSEYVGMLKNKEIDLISNMVITKERKKSFIFTQNSTFTTYKSLFSNNKKKYKNFEELKNKNLGLVKDNYEEKIIKNNYENINIKAYETNQKLIEALLNNEVDAIIGNSTVINYLLDENFITSIYYVNIINNFLPLKTIHFAFHKDNKLLKSIVDKAMSFIDDKKLRELKNKWKLNLNAHNTLTKYEIALLKKNKLLAYYNEKGWYPFIFSDNNIVKGISIDFWNEITKNLNLEVSFEAIPSFDEILDLIKNKKNTFVPSSSSTKDRESFAAFTKPYASFPIAIATNSKEDFLIDLKELEGRKVAVGKNYTAHKLLQKHYPKIDFVTVKDIQTALDLLANEKVYAAADILPVINYELNKYGFTNLKISGTSKFNFDIQIMVNKQNEQLIPILNKLIDNIDENEKQKIINKWLQNTRIEKIDYTIAYWIALISFLIISFILYRQTILRKQKIAIEKEIKIATQELKELNQIHEETQELAKIATVKKNLKIDKYWVSKQFYEIFEVEQDSEITSEKILSRVDENDKYRLIKFFEKNEKYKSKAINYDNTIIKILIPTKKTKYLELFLSCEFDENFQAIQRKVTIQDITEKVLAKKEDEKKEAIFLQQSKLASMGEMIGAIAHQWRQPLNELSIRIQKLKYNYAKEQIDE